VDDFIRDLKDVVWAAKGNPAGKGNMVTLYGACTSDKRVGCPRFFSRKIDDVRSGLGNSSAVGPHLVGTVVTAFLDALYKA
jgi:sphinganine-1-phosphate aldolase